MKRLALFVFGYLVLGAAVAPERLGEMAAVMIPGAVILYAGTQLYVLYVWRDIEARRRAALAAIRRRQEAERRLEEALNRR